MHAIRVLILVLPALLATSAAWSGPLRCPEDSDGGACVWGRIDGFEPDSVQVRGLRVQLMGITAPGPRDLCGSRSGKGDFPCARPARKRMAELTAKGVACELFDVGGDTLHGRCRTADGADLGRALVTSGVVRSVKDGPYEDEQAAALAAGKGLWSPDIAPPKDWEALRRKAAKD